MATCACLLQKNPAMREYCSECGLFGGRGEPGGNTRTCDTERRLLAGVRASETASRRERQEGNVTNHCRWMVLARRQAVCLQMRTGRQHGPDRKYMYAHPICPMNRFHWTGSQCGSGHAGSVCAARAVPGRLSLGHTGALASADVLQLSHGGGKGTRAETHALTTRRKDCSPASTPARQHLGGR